MSLSLKAITVRSRRMGEGASAVETAAKGRKGSLFDHLVSGHEQTGRHGPAESLCRLDIENSLKLGRRLHRKIGRLRAAQDAVHIFRRLPKLVNPFHPVGHEATCGDKEAVRIDGRQAMLCRERDDEVAMSIGCAVRQYDQAAFRRGMSEGGNSAADISSIVLDWSKHRLDLKLRRGDLGTTQVEIIIGSCFGIDHESHTSKPRLNLLEHP